MLTALSIMSSSVTLALSAKGSPSDLRGKWLKHNNNTGFEVHTSQNQKKPKARFFSVCFAAPCAGWKKASGCRAHIKAVGDSTEEMTIESLDLVHICGAMVGRVRRKRNYLTKDISEVSTVLDLHEPTATKAGNTKQFIAMTKSAPGVTVKTGQAALAVRNKSNNSIEAQIGQHVWIPSLFRAYKQDDLVGTHICESKQCSWSWSLHQFER